MEFFKESLLTMIQIVYSLSKNTPRLYMLLQWLSQKSIVSPVVISDVTAMTVVVLDKVIVREKSARLISFFCFGKMFLFKQLLK